MAKDAHPPVEEVTAMTTEMLKAMANPLRRRIIRLAKQRGHLRAADVAAELGIPANSASFHMRVLGEAGLLVDAPEKARDRRDRVWSGVNAALSLGGPEHPIQDEALAETALRTAVDDHQELVRRIVRWSQAHVTGRDAGVHGTFQQRVMRLTTAELSSLMDKVSAAMAEAEAAHDPGDPDGRYWQIDIVAADDLI